MCSDEVFLKHALELARASTNLCTPLHNQVMRLIKSRHADFWTMYRSVAKPFNALETNEISPSGANAISTSGGSRTKWYRQNGMDKMVYGQNGTDKMVRTKWYG